MTVYKEMKPCHAAEAARIEGLCFSGRFGEQTFFRELENKIAYYIVAETDGKVSGYGGLWLICGEADITDIAVDPNFRRRGIGEGLLSELIAYCRSKNCKKIHLEVRESNFAALSLYEKCGFVRSGERKKYYENRETAILMCLVL